MSSGEPVVLWDPECCIYDHSKIDTYGGHGLHACQCGTIVSRCLCEDHQRVTKVSANVCTKCKREQARGTAG